MYHPRGGRKAAAVAQESLSDNDDIGSDYSDEERQQVYHTREPIAASAAADAATAAAAPPQHLQSEMFSHTQKVWLDIDITGSPEDLHAGNTSTTWKLLPHLPAKYLRQNLAVENRHLAGDEHLAGDLRQCIPLGFEIVEHSNSFPYPMAIRAPGMMDKTLHRDGACLWRVQPDTKPNMMVGIKAFEPTGIIDTHMYHNYSMCPLETLDTDITIVEGGGGKGAKKATAGYGRIATNSVPYETLISNLDLGMWRDELTEVELNNIYDAPARHLRSVDVPKHIAEQIRDTLRPIVQETIDRCVNLEDMNFEIFRADGNPKFNSPKGLIGSVAHGDSDPENRATDRRLMETCVFHIKAQFAFALLGDKK